MSPVASCTNERTLGLRKVPAEVVIGPSPLVAQVVDPGGNAGDRGVPAVR